MLEIDWLGFLRWLVRRPLPLIVASIAGALLGLLAALVVPPTYRASTLIFVEPSAVPTDIVKPTVNLNIQERLGTLQQQITNRANLESIIRELSLYPKLIETDAIELAVERAARALELEVHGKQVFQVSFDARDPVLAAKTANRIAEVFIDTNLEIREQRARGTTSFLDAELGATKAALEEREAEIASFKRSHLGELPEQQEALLRSIDAAQDRLALTVASVDTAEKRRTALRREISELSRLAGDSDARGGGAPRMSSRRVQLEQELAVLLAQYTEKHPDVVRLREELSRLRDSNDAIAEITDDGLAAAGPPTGEQAYLFGLMRELETVEIEIGSLESEKARLAADIGRDRVSLRRIPTVESELLALSRDYQNLKNSYDSLLEKKIDAGLAENLEKRQQGEQFRILDRALPPTRRHAPSRVLLLLIGSALGGFVGLAFSLLRFQTDSRFNDVGALREFAPGVELLGAIPTVDFDRRFLDFVDRSDERHGLTLVDSKTRWRIGSWF